MKDTFWMTAQEAEDEIKAREAAREFLANVRSANLEDSAELDAAVIMAENTINAR